MHSQLKIGLYTKLTNKKKSSCCWGGLTLRKSERPHVEAPIYYCRIVQKTNGKCRALKVERVRQLTLSGDLQNGQNGAYVHIDILICNEYTEAKSVNVVRNLNPRKHFPLATKHNKPSSRYESHRCIQTTLPTFGKKGEFFCKKYTCTCALVCQQVQVCAS